MLPDVQAPALGQGPLSAHASHRGPSARTLVAAAELPPSRMVGAAAPPATLSSSDCTPCTPTGTLVYCLALCAVLPGFVIVGLQCLDCCRHQPHHDSNPDLAHAVAAGIFGFRPTLHCYNYTNTLVPATFTRDTVGRFSVYWLSIPSCTCSYEPTETRKRSNSHLGLAHCSAAACRQHGADCRRSCDA